MGISFLLRPFLIIAYFHLCIESNHKHQIYGSRYTVIFVSASVQQSTSSQHCSCGLCDDVLDTKERCDCCVYLLNGKRSTSDNLLNDKRLTSDNLFNGKRSTSNYMYLFNDKHSTSNYLLNGKRSTSYFLLNGKHSTSDISTFRRFISVNNRDINDGSPSCLWPEDPLLCGKNHLLWTLIKAMGHPIDTRSQLTFYK